MYFTACTAKHSTHIYSYNYSKKESLKRHQEKCGSERKSTGVRSSKRERKPKVFADHYQSSGDEDYEESDDSFDYDDDDRGGNEDTNTEESGQYRGGGGDDYHDYDDDDRGGNEDTNTEESGQIDF